MTGPHIDWAAFSPIVAAGVGGCFVLLLGLARPRWAREGAVPLITLGVLAAIAGLSIWQWDTDASIISGALRVDRLSLMLNLLFAVAGATTVGLAWRGRAAVEAGHGELYALLLFTIMGMAVLVAAQNLVTLFLGFELLSIPLYVLCATEMRRASSLESGLKYLIVGSVGSATLLYGLAFIYGATGSTDFAHIHAALGRQTGSSFDVLLLTGIALSVAGLAFKASVAPFHQWTPDVYEGAPTPITAFMAVATKAAAFGVFLRLFDDALSWAAADWGPWLAVLAATTIIVGNVGALGQSSLKRMLAYSSVAQAGYMLCGVLVASELGVNATLFYLAVYLVMNLAAFAVIVARERETIYGDDLRAVQGIGGSRPWLAWPMTLAMLGLAGIPATAGFVGKIYLIDALVARNYTWLAVVLVVGSMISLAYYLRVIAAMWMRPAPDRVAAEPGALRAGAQPAIAGAEAAGERPHLEVHVLAVVFGAATLVLGIVPGPLFQLVGKAGAAVFGSS